MADKIACLHCKRMLADKDGAHMHVTAKHRGKKNPFASSNRLKVDNDGDESIASLVVQAGIDRACGEEIPDWLEEMMP